MGGSAGPMSQIASKTGAQNQSTAQPVAGYTPAQTQPTYQPAFNSNQAVQFSPAVQQAAQQQMSYQQQQNPLFSQMRQGYSPQQQGLQQLLGSMMNRYQQPQVLPQQSMPQYSRFNSQGNPLAYRPTMQPAEQSLNRVAKSVILQQKEAAEAELAKMKAEQEAAQQNSYRYDGGSA
jgi:hypothetical protein